MALSVNLNTLLPRVRCCIVDTAYRALTQDMYLKPERFKTFQTVRYLQALYDILLRYNGSNSCLTEAEAQGVVDQVTEVCAFCTSCTGTANPY